MFPIKYSVRKQIKILIDSQLLHTYIIYLYVIYMYEMMERSTSIILTMIFPGYEHCYCNDNFFLFFLTTYCLVFLQ